MHVHRAISIRLVHWVLLREYRLLQSSSVKITLNRVVRNLRSISIVGVQVRQDIFIAMRWLLCVAHKSPNEHGAGFEALLRLQSLGKASLNEAVVGWRA